MSMYDKNIHENPLKCCEVISLQLIKINEKIKKNKVIKASSGIIEMSWDPTGIEEGV